MQEMERRYKRDDQKRTTIGCLQSVPRTKKVIFDRIEQILQRIFSLGRFAESFGRLILKKVIFKRS